MQGVIFASNHYLPYLGLTAVSRLVTSLPWPGSIR